MTRAKDTKEKYEEESIIYIIAYIQKLNINHFQDFFLFDLYFQFLHYVIYEFMMILFSTIFIIFKKEFKDR